MSSIPNIPDTIAREIYAELCRSLPPRADDTPESRAIREQLAMTSVAHLLPENAAEANVAVQIVAAQFHARDTLQAATCRTSGLDPGTDADPETVRRCRAQAASMMRQADSGIRTLLRLQAERQKAETAMRPAAMERAGYWFRSVSPEPDPEPAKQPPLPLREEPAPDLSRGGGGRGPVEPPKLEYGAMTPAGRLVTLYPDRAAAVLAAGGLPARLTFAPPDPAAITELLTGSSPLIRAFRQARTSEPWPATGLDPVAA
jgi:hypothetical protein